MQYDQREMQRLSAGLPSKSAKIRTLGGAGYTRQQIATFLGIRYQHVRNVLLDAERKAAVNPAEPEDSVQEDRTRYPSPPQRVVHAEVRADGAIIVPAASAEQAGFVAGKPVVVWVQGDGAVALLSPEAAVKRVQEMVRAVVPEGVSLVDELLADRRRESAREKRQSGE
jgi:hypothetical protein